MNKMNKKQDLYEKYLKLMKQEEERIKKLSIKKFRYLKTTHSIPSMVIGERRKGFEPKTYEQARQRYYRLRRIKESDIEDKLNLMDYDNYVVGVEICHERLGKTRTSEYKRAMQQLKSLNKEERDIFVRMGYTQDVADIYEDLVEYYSGDFAYNWYEFIDTKIGDVKNIIANNQQYIYK